MKLLYYTSVLLFVACCILCKCYKSEENQFCTSSSKAIFQDLIIRWSRRKYEDRNILPSSSKMLSKSQVNKTCLFLLMFLCGDLEVNPGPMSILTLKVDNHSTQLLYKIKKLNEKVTSSSLHQSYLQKYKDNKVIPKGLIVNTSPQIHSYNSVLQDWTSVCESTSFKFLDILIYEHQRNIADLESKIKSMKGELKQSINNQEGFFSALEWLDSHRDKFYNKTSSRKSRKFNNDFNKSINHGNNSFTLRKLFDDSTIAETQVHNDSTQEEDAVQTGSQQSNNETLDPSSNSEFADQHLLTNKESSKDIGNGRIGEKPTDSNEDNSVVNQDNVSSSERKRRKHNRSFHRGRKSQAAKIIDNHDIVVNLSNYQLSNDEISILAKGLNFVPTPKKINTTQIKADCAAFSRRVRWKEFFYGQPNCEPRAELKLKNSTPKAPPRDRDRVLDLYLQQVEEAVLQQQPKKTKSNISHNEQQALINLRKNKDIVIFQADKGGAVVVQNRSDYIAEANKQFNSVDSNNENVYLKLTSDISKDIEKKVVNVINQVKHSSFITDKMCDELHVRNPRPSNIYFLPKIHKKLNKPPGRPICNTIGSATENLSKWVDHQLKPFVKTLPSFLEDDNDFLRKIDELNTKHTLKEGTMLVTWDVKSLYTNIPHHGGLRAVASILNMNEVPGPLKNAIIKFVNVILKNNNIQFGGEHYLQVSGTAMGTKMAPNYANIFMGFLEEKLLRYPKKPLVWWRYIDDVFFIWEHGEEELKKFYDFSNSNEFGIEFEQNLDDSHTSVPFLDVKVSIIGNKLSTDLYTKPTDKHQYLSWDSCHPFHTIRNLPYSLALRLRRICMVESDFEKRCKDMSQRLLRRGYKNKYIKEGIQKARNTSRADALMIREEAPSKNDVIFTTTYNSRLPDVSKTLKEKHPLLMASTRCQEVFPKTPMVGYRRDKNVGDIVMTRRLPPETRLTQTDTQPLKQSESTTCEQCDRHFDTIRAKKIHYSKQHKIAVVSKTNFGLNKCNDARCKTCTKTAIHDTEIHITATGETFVFNQKYSCHDRCIIYLVTCQKCLAQYVGKTVDPLHVRSNGHTSDIDLLSKSLPYVKHFGVCGLKNYRICILETVRSKNSDILSSREQYYIKRFKPSINVRVK